MIKPQKMILMFKISATTPTESQNIIELRPMGNEEIRDDDLHINNHIVDEEMLLEEDDEESIVQTEHV